MKAGENAAKKTRNWTFLFQGTTQIDCMIQLIQRKQLNCINIHYKGNHPVHPWKHAPDNCSAAEMQSFIRKKYRRMAGVLVFILSLKRDRMEEVSLKGSCSAAYW